MIDAVRIAVFGMLAVGWAALGVVIIVKRRARRRRGVERGHWLRHLRCAGVACPDCMARWRREHRAAWEEAHARYAALRSAIAEAQASGDDALVEVLRGQLGPPPPKVWMPPSYEWR